MSDRWVSVTDVAEHVETSCDTTYLWIEAKGLQAYRAGLHWKFKFSEVDR